MNWSVLIFIYLRWPDVCILDAVFTVSPNKQYRGILLPTIPATHGPKTKTKKFVNALERETLFNSIHFWKAIILQKLKSFTYPSASPLIFIGHGVVLKHMHPLSGNYKCLAKRRQAFNLRLLRLRLARTCKHLRWLAMACVHFGWDQINTQFNARFSPFGHPAWVIATVFACFWIAAQ